jgi:hypothetical protein
LVVVSFISATYAAAAGIHLPRAAHTLRVFFRVPESEWEVTDFWILNLKSRKYKKLFFCGKPSHPLPTRALRTYSSIALPALLYQETKTRAPAFDNAVIL